MAEIKLLVKDILKSPENMMIMHQVNCKGRWKHGVAKDIFTKYPSIEKQYTKLCETETPRELLGRAVILKDPSGRMVCNIFSQRDYRTEDDKDMHISYGAMERAFRFIEGTFDIMGYEKNVAMPWLIGADSGGDMEVIHRIVLKELVDKGTNVTYYAKDYSTIPLMISKYDRLMPDPLFYKDGIAF